MVKQTTSKRTSNLRIHYIMFFFWVSFDVYSPVQGNLWAEGGDGHAPSALPCVPSEILSHNLSKKWQLQIPKQSESRTNWRDQNHHCQGQLHKQRFSKLSNRFEKNQKWLFKRQEKDVKRRLKRESKGCIMLRVHWKQINSLHYSSESLP